MRSPRVLAFDPNLQSILNPRARPLQRVFFFASHRTAGGFIAFRFAV